MIIQCDQCSTRFKLDDAKVTEAGVKVRCRKCQHIFRVRKESPQEDTDLDTLFLGLHGSTSPQPATSTSSDQLTTSTMFPNGTDRGTSLADTFDEMPQTFVPLAPPPAIEISPEILAPHTPDTPASVPLPSSEHESPTTFDSLLREHPADSPWQSSESKEISSSEDQQQAPETQTDSAPLPDDATFTFDIPSATHDDAEESEVPPPPPPASTFATSGAADTPDHQEITFGFDFEEESAPVLMTDSDQFATAPSETTTSSTTEFERFTDTFPVQPPASDSAQEEVDAQDASIPAVTSPNDTVAWEGFDGFEIDLPESAETGSLPLKEATDVASSQWPSATETDQFTPESSSPPVDQPEEPGSRFTNVVPAEAPLLDEETLTSGTDSATRTPHEPASDLDSSVLTASSSHPLSQEEFPHGEYIIAPNTVSSPDPGDDQFSFDSEPPSPSFRRKTPSPAGMFGMAILLLVVIALAGIGGLYAVKGPEALQKLGLGAIVRVLGKQHKSSDRIIIRNIEGSYLTNDQGGELFIIRGEAFNNFATPRAAIQVRGLIYNASGAVILRKTAYCGNNLTSEQLRSLPLAKIDEAMNNRLGDALANIGTPTNKSVQFLIVFANLPKDAADYAVELVGSQAVGQ